VLVTNFAKHQYLQDLQRYLFVSSSMISTPENSPLITISRAEYERLLQTEKDLEKAKLEQSYLRQEIANLKRMLFGKKSQHQNPKRKDQNPIQQPKTPPLRATAESLYRLICPGKK